MPFRTKKFELSPRLKLGVGRGYSQNQILKISAIICLLLALGLTINGVRLIVKSKNQPNVNGASVLGVSDTKQASDIELTTYTVLKNDTLFSISQKFNLSWNALATLNNLKSPYYLKPGQTLKVPKQ